MNQQPNPVPPASVETKPDSRRASASQTATIVAVQTAFAVVLAVGLMLLLRGEAASKEARENWIWLHGPPLPPPPVIPRWSSERDMLAAAPLADVEEFEMQLPGLKIHGRLPKGTQQVGYEFNYTIDLPSHNPIEFQPGHLDMVQTGQSQTRGKSIIFLDEDSLLVELDKDTEDRFSLYANFTFGYHELHIRYHTNRGTELRDCLDVLSAVRNLRATQDFPTDPAEYIRLAGGSVGRNPEGKVTQVALGGHPITPGSSLLEKLKEFPDLVALEIPSHAVSTEAFAFLEQLPSLRHLYIGGAPATYEIGNRVGARQRGFDSSKLLAMIGNCQQLESLRVEVSYASPEQLGKLRQLTQLKRLGLFGIEGEQLPALQTIGSLPQLERLELGFRVGSEADWSPEGLAFLPKLTHLQWLGLHGDLSDEAAAHVADSVPQLKTLALLKMSVSDRGLVELARLENLVSLTLEEDYGDPKFVLSSDGVATLVRLRQLKHLVFERVPITDEAVESLTALPNLNDLTLLDCEITDAALEQLAGYKPLQALTVEQCDRVSSAALANFRQGRQGVLLAYDYLDETLTIAGQPLVLDSIENDDSPYESFGLWPSREAMLAETPQTALVEKTFWVGNVNYSIQLPETANVKVSPYYPGEILVRFDSGEVLEFYFEHADLERSRDTMRGGRSFADDQLLVEMHSEQGRPRYEFTRNMTVGYLRLHAAPVSTYEAKLIAEEGETVYQDDDPWAISKSDCLLMLRCAETLRQVSDLPTDPKALLALVGGRLHYDRPNEVSGVDLQYVLVATPEIVACAKVFPNLKWLRLGRHDLDDDSLTFLADMENFQHLHMGTSWVSPVMFREICQLERLQTLRISMAGIPATDVAKLGQLQELFRLTASSLDREHLAELGALSKLSALSELEIDRVYDFVEDTWPPESLAFLSDLESLSTLKIGGRCGDRSVERLPSLTGLTELHLDNAKLTDAGIVHVSRLSGLTTLSIREDFDLEGEELLDITVQGWQALAAMPQLESFRWNGDQFDDEALEQLAAIKSLKHAAVTSDNLTVDAVAKFSAARPDVRLTAY